MTRRHIVKRIFTIAAFTVASLAHAQEVTSKGKPAGPPSDIRAYIAEGWDTLSRSMSDCKSVADPKVTSTPVLYLPADMATPDAVTAMLSKRWNPARPATSRPPCGEGKLCFLNTPGASMSNAQSRPVGVSAA